MKTRCILSLVVGLLSLIMGFVTEARNGNKSSDVRKADQQLMLSFKPNQPVLEWQEIEKTCENLTWLNQEIFKAKALVKYEEVGGFNEPPEGALSWDWGNRHKASLRPYLVQEDPDYYLQKVKMGILAGICGTVAAFFSLWFLSWGWSFFLARLSEISAAIRGK